MILRQRRLWALLELIYGVILLVIGSNWIPKAFWLSIFTQVYGLLHFFSSIDLLTGKFGGGKFSRYLAIFGVIIGMLCIWLAALSFGYWRGVYGILGWGVSIAILLVMSGLIQLLIIYPVLKLIYVQETGARSHSHRRVKTYGGGGIFLTMVFWFCGVFCGHVHVVQPLSTAQATQVLQAVRLSLEGENPQTLSLDLVEGEALDFGPLYISFWAGGMRVARVTGRGIDIAQATRNAAQALRSHPKVQGRRLLGGRLTLDRIVGSKTLYTANPMFVSLSVKPGEDGLRVTRGGRVRTLLASDFIQQDRFGHMPLLPGLKELRFGLDIQPVLQRLGKGTIERIRSEQWVESFELQSPEERSERGLAQARSVRSGRMNHDIDDEWLNGIDDPIQTLQERRPLALERAISAGDYLVRHLGQDGRFDYKYYPITGVIERGITGYSIPRHAGVIYSLVRLYEVTQTLKYADAARHAIQWLLTMIESECSGQIPTGGCVNTEGKYFNLGPIALSAIALISYASTTGDLRDQSTIKSLLETIIYLQGGKGDFAHRIKRSTGEIDHDARVMFASEQATFALVLASKLWPSNQRWLNAAQRALDRMTTKKYTDFMGQFFYAADHWTCLAAEAGWPRLNRKEYLDFCVGYSHFLKRLQYQPYEGPSYYRGHYGFGFITHPQAPATAGFGEAVTATLKLATYHNKTKEERSVVAHQALLTVDALIVDQLDATQSWNIPNAFMSAGGWRRSLIEPEIRIDFVQHALNVLLMVQK